MPACFVVCCAFHSVLTSVFLLLRPVPDEQYLAGRPCMTEPMYGIRQGLHEGLIQTDKVGVMLRDAVHTWDVVCSAGGWLEAL